MSTYKALSIHQPYADFIKSGLKIMEIRSWQTHYRGKIIICSTKNPYYDNKLCGYTLCVADIVDCRLMKKTDEKYAAIKYIPGYFSWILNNIKIINPKKIIGKQGLFNVSADIFK